MRHGVAMCMVLTAMSAFAVEPDPAGYERLLVPVVAVARPGAFGSQWRAELTVRNEADVPAQIFQRECAFFCTCGATVMCTVSEIRPHSATLGSLVPANRPGNVGAFIYVNRPRAEDLAVQLRVRDLSRQSESWGTEVPIVRDRDMLTSRAHVLDIPIRGDLRSHLRVYGASSPSGMGEVHVRFYTNNGNTLLAERTLTLVQADIGTEAPPRVIPTDDERPAVPAYAELVDLSFILPSGVADSFRLEITPLTTGLKFWVMVSVTNNVTQHLTLITPQ